MITCPIPELRWGDRRTGRRILIFIVVVTAGTALSQHGLDLETVLYALTGLGLTGAAMARTIVDGAERSDVDRAGPSDTQDESR